MLIRSVSIPPVVSEIFHWINEKFDQLVALDKKSGDHQIN